MLCIIHRAQGSDERLEMDWSSRRSARMVEIPEGTFVMGSDEPSAYDNEKRAHEVSVEGFSLGEEPVTAFEWSRFIEEGGYRSREFWSDEGWAWRCENEATAPASGRTSIKPGAIGM